MEIIMAFKGQKQGNVPRYWISNALADISFFKKVRQVPIKLHILPMKAV